MTLKIGTALYSGSIRARPPKIRVSLVRDPLGAPFYVAVFPLVDGSVMHAWGNTPIDALRRMRAAFGCAI